MSPKISIFPPSKMVYNFSHHKHSECNLTLQALNQWVAWMLLRMTTTNINDIHSNKDVITMYLHTIILPLVHWSGHTSHWVGIIAELTEGSRKIMSELKQWQCIPCIMHKFIFLQILLSDKSFIILNGYFHYPKICGLVYICIYVHYQLVGGM